MKKRRDTDSLILHYDLDSLPTAQHKAGLAGLLLMIESMKDGQLAPLPEVRRLSRVSVEVEITQASLQAVFDDLFDACWEEVSSKSKRKGKGPKRVEQSADGERAENRYIYDSVRLKGRFLRIHYPDGDGVWMKLWRDMIWSTLRGRHKNRVVFEERANGNPSSEADKLWRCLKKAVLARSNDQIITTSISSSLFIGAQDVNAERIPFQGEPQHNLLLYFWPIVSSVYAPRRFTIKGDIEDAGYVLVVPEPTDIGDFVCETAKLLRSLDTSVSGYRPRDALIDVPAEGGLEYLYHLARQRVAESEITSCLSAVEIYHLEKWGNDIRALAAERVVPNAQVLRLYDLLRQQCHNPICKSVRIHNLLADRPWYERMGSAFGQYTVEFFIGIKDRTPRRIPFFGDDVRRKFEAIEAELEFAKGDDVMNDEVRDDLLAQRVYRLIRTYVNQKTESKSEIKYNEFKEDKDDNGRTRYPEKYRNAQEKVCSDAFLAMRGRRDTDFIEYFTSTICSVPQWLPEDDYLVISQSLLADWNKIKTLSMLALSACSYHGKNNATQQEGEVA